MAQKMSVAERARRLQAIGRKMVRPGADLVQLNREIDAILGIPSDLSKDGLGSDWQHANHGDSPDELDEDK